LLSKYNFVLVCVMIGKKGQVVDKLP